MVYPLDRFKDCIYLSIDDEAFPCLVHLPFILLPCSYALFENDWKKQRWNGNPADEIERTHSWFGTSDRYARVSVNKGYSVKSVRWQYALSKDFFYFAFSDRARDVVLTGANTALMTGANAEHRLKAICSFYVSARIVVSLHDSSMQTVNNWKWQKNGNRVGMSEKNRKYIIQPGRLRKLMHVYW